MQYKLLQYTLPMPDPTKAESDMAALTSEGYQMISAFHEHGTIVFIFGKHNHDNDASARSTLAKIIAERMRQAGVHVSDLASGDEPAASSIYMEKEGPGSDDPIRN